MGILTEAHPCCGQIYGHTRWCDGKAAPAAATDASEPGTGWIQTFTGKKFFPLDPDPALICIEDIAHALGNLCRYGGHSTCFYSVGQHSVRVSECYGETMPGMRLAALLHDASEAYLGDIVRPLKYLPEFEFIRQAEERLQRTINLRFGLPPNIHLEVKKYDHELFLREVHCRQIMAPRHAEWVVPEPQVKENGYFAAWSPELSESQFLRAFNGAFNVRRDRDL